MKKTSWLNALENLSLVGLGAGSVASLLLQQVFFTTAPLSLLVVLGLMNRRSMAKLSERRDATLAETDQYLALQVDRLQNQMALLPRPEALNQLNRTLLFKNQELAEKLQGELGSLKQGLHQRIALVEQQGLNPIRKDMRQVIEQYGTLVETVNQLSSDMGKLSSQVRTDSVRLSVEQLKSDVVVLQNNLDNLAYQTKPSLSALQEHVTRIDRQFSKLPPPVDITSLKQEVAELVKIVADLVPRRDLSTVVGEMQEIQQQQETLKHSIVAIETVALNFKRTLNDLLQPTRSLLNGVRETGRVSGFGDAPDATHSIAASIYPELQDLAVHYFDNLRDQIDQIQNKTTNLAQQHQQLQEHLGRLPKTLDVVALQRQLSELSQRMPDAESTIATLQSHIQELLHQELKTHPARVSSQGASQSELIFDFSSTDVEAENWATGSRVVLEQALECTQQRLILIWPWSERCRLDDALFQKFERFLGQQRQLEIGWCYLADRHEERWLSKMQRGWMTDFSQRSLLQETLHKLLQLKRRYPDRFQFKILGTSENFLVSDESFAVLGITDALQTTTPFPALQLKLKTTDVGVIQRLIKRFDDSTLAADDFTSYWNRAVTRYDLGDKAGAIADFTHILTLYPDDAMAYNYRGLAHYDAEDYTSAITDFTEAIQIDPHQPAPYCNRGFIRAEQGDYWNAIKDYTQAIQVSPQYAIAYFYRGLAHQKSENYSVALTDLSDAIQFAPDSPVAYYYRALTWQKLGNLVEAIGDFELASQFFWVRGNKVNAQKAQANIVKLRQELASDEDSANSAVYQSR